MILCLLVRDFAVTLERQADPSLADMALILAEYSERHGKVIAVSPEAQQMGVQPGLSLSRARALCPDGCFRPADLERYQDTSERLLETLWDFTHRVEVAEDGFPQTALYYLDLGQLREADTRDLGEHCFRVVSQQYGLTASVGLATGKFPAYVAAASTNVGQTVYVPRGSEAEFVAACPVSLLPLDKETARLLRLSYIREIGQLAALPRAALVAQFGRRGRLLHSLAHGQDGRPVHPRRMPPSEAVTRYFDDPLTDRTRLDVAIHILAGELEAWLAARHAALHAISVTLHLEREEPRTERLHLLQPVASAAGIASTIHRLLTRKPITGGIAGLEVCVTHLVPNTPQQLELFNRRPGRQCLLDLTRTLAARHGRDCFFEAELAERGSLLPERRFCLTRLEVS